MPNEFIIKNGYRSQGNSEVTGSVNISGSLSIIGAQQSSVNNVLTYDTSSGLVTYTSSAAIGGGGTSTSGFPFTGSAIISGSLSVTGSISATAGVTASLQGTASWAQNAVSASLATSASFATSTNTGSLLTAASFLDPNITFTRGNGTTFNVDLTGISSQSPQGTYSTLTASILSGTNVTLPGGLTYVSSSTYEYIEVHVNGLQLRYDIDFIPTTTSSVQFNITIPSGSELIYKSYKRP